MKWWSKHPGQNSFQVNITLGSSIADRKIWTWQISCLCWWMVNHHWWCIHWRSRVYEEWWMPRPFLQISKILWQTCSLVRVSKCTHWSQYLLLWWSLRRIIDQYNWHWHWTTGLSRGNSGTKFHCICGNKKYSILTRICSMKQNNDTNKISFEKVKLGQFHIGKSVHIGKSGWKPLRLREFCLQQKSSRFFCFRWYTLRLIWLGAKLDCLGFQLNYYWSGLRVSSIIHSDPF